MNNEQTEALPEGMVPWPGGDTAPEDWDGGPVLRRNGHYSLPDGQFAWSSNGGGPGNIIAYKRKAPSFDVAEEMALFEATYRSCDHAKYQNGEIIAGRVRYADPEIDKMFSAWLSARWSARSRPKGGALMNRAMELRIARIIYDADPDIEGSQFSGPHRRAFDDARSRGLPKAKSAQRLALTIRDAIAMTDTLERREAIARALGEDAPTASAPPADQ